MAANLCLEERVQIVAGIAGQKSGHKIAQGLGRSHTAINTEIRRNGGRSSYCALAAQARADSEAERPKEPILAADKALARHVVARLEAGDSPWSISVELETNVYGFCRNISHETIYRAIYLRILKPTHPGERLRTPHCQRKQRRCRDRRVKSRNRLEPYNRIDSRPATANDRSEIGHLEGDLIVGANNQSAAVTIVDRLSRKLWIAETNSKSKDDVFDALVLLFYKRIPVEAHKTLTWDQGAEIGRHRELSQLFDIGIYIADPKSPWQRGTNEVTNSHIRRYAPKGTNLKLLTATDLLAIETRLNTTPRRLFNKATANQIFAQAGNITT